MANHKRRETDKGEKVLKGGRIGLKTSLRIIKRIHTALVEHVH